ncbi:MAG: hypothetical protein KAJ07_00475 [Planctomycetes bacterium]|nr:hypothetical protein [Planctomycetota bacterium]
MSMLSDPNDPKGQTSSMRVMCFCSLVVSVVFGFITLTRPMADPNVGIYITTIFVVGAFAPKAVQKFAEEKVK